MNLCTNRRPARRSGATALIATCLTMASIGIAATGCGDDSSGDSTGTSASNGNKPVSIAVELPGGLDYITKMKAGMAQAAEDFGPIDLDVSQGPAALDTAAMQKQVTDMLAKGPDAIAISPFPSGALWRGSLTTVRQRVKYRLATLIKPTDTPEGVPSALLSTYVGQDDTALGHAAMTDAIKLAKLDENTTGVALIAQCIPGNSGVLYERAQGLKQAVEELLPKVTVKIFTTAPLPTKSLGAWSNMIAANPDTVIASGSCDFDGGVAYLAKKRAGKDFAIAALEAPPDTIRGLEDGGINVAYAVNWWASGYATVKLLADAARSGKEVPAGWYDTGYTRITRENVDEIAERDASQATAKAWFVPKLEPVLEQAPRPMTDSWKPQL